MKICEIEGCDREHQAQGLCKKHYNNKLRHGFIITTKRNTRDPVCTIAGCEYIHQSQGLCQFHYDRMRRPLFIGPPKPNGLNKCIIEGCNKVHLAHGLCKNHYENKIYPSQRDRKRNSYYIRKYGITLLQYNNMLDNQKGLCKICGNPESAMHRENIISNLAVDHCHTTGIVRGLLCNRCNKCLGQLEESKPILKSMLTYLEEFTDAGRC